MFETLRFIPRMKLGLILHLYLPLYSISLDFSLFLGLPVFLSAFFIVLSFFSEITEAFVRVLLCKEVLL